MPDNDKQFDPANPENKAITDGMERDGEFLRDVKDGKTPTELAFGVDLGTDEAQELQDEHEALQSELGQIIAEEESRTSPVDPTPIEIETPDISPDATPGPVAQVQVQHDDLMMEVGAVTKKESARATRRTEAAQRRQSEHGQAFVELQDTIERSRPAPPDMPLTPAQLARLAHPGREKPGQFGEAFAEFAAEDKEWRAKIVEVLQAMAGDIRQSRLELDQLLGFLERSRL
jgi:hypothetical protein